MNKDNNFGRLLLLLLLAFGICLGLYYLPDQLFGMKIKKVDLLSDLRIKPESLSMDSLRMQLEQPDTVRIDSAAVRDSILKTTGRKWNCRTETGFLNILYSNIQNGSM